MRLAKSTCAGLLIGLGAGRSATACCWLITTPEGGSVPRFVASSIQANDREVCAAQLGRMLPGCLVSSDVEEGDPEADLSCLGRSQLAELFGAKRVQRTGGRRPARRNERCEDAHAEQYQSDDRVGRRIERAHP